MNITTPVCEPKNVFQCPACGRTSDSIDGSRRCANSHPKPEVVREFLGYDDAEDLPEAVHIQFSNGSIVRYQLARVMQR